jgi:hypothetical protein
MGQAMIPISLTWGDVLVHVLIGLGVAFVVFLLTILYRHAAPWVSDYWARRSVAAAQRQIPRLERVLAAYEADFADYRLFTGRIIVKAIGPVILLLMVILLTIFGMSYYMLGQMYCEIHNNCVDVRTFSVMRAVTTVISNPEFSQFGVAILLLLLALVFEFLFFVASGQLSLEISPEKYRARLSNRIARLRDRISEG